MAQEEPFVPARPARRESTSDTSFAAAQRDIAFLKQQGLMSSPFTLSRWLLTEKQKYPKATGDFTILLNAIQLAVKIIAQASNKAGIFQMYGFGDDQKENSSGEQQKKLDVFSNDVFINCISYTGKVGIMASEEMEEAISVDTRGQPAKYCVVFDPLDGSSNIDANVSVGSIFGIYRVKDPAKPVNEDLLQKGSELACAGYAMYGDATMMVITFGDTVQGFTLDPQLGEFILTDRDMKVKPKGKIYSVNEGNARHWDKAVTEYVKRCKDPPKGKPKKARYIGSMVADIHRTLVYGGIFLYPADENNLNGKLRLLYELNPMAFIMEAAGGAASTGKQRILDLQPTRIHERAPCIMGSKQDVEEVMALYAELCP